MADVDFKGALVFTGGGTGGHFFPAVALAEGAKERWPDRAIAFVGAKRGIEAKKLPGSPWPHVLLDVEGFLGRSPLSIIRSLWKLRVAFSEMKHRFREQRPWAVIGTGGYGAAPALLAARSLGIPFFLHESNAEPGALVKLVAPKARRVWLGMEAARRRIPRSDCLLVGTPVRAAFLRDFKPLDALDSPFRLLVLGGSGGARAINEAMLDIGPALLEIFQNWEILHQAGPAEFERLKDRLHHGRHVLVPFIEDADQAFEGASLVISRSGASTCAELKACGRPAILIPLPTSAGDHQRMNAKAMASEGRALLVEQNALPFELQVQAERLMADAVARKALFKPERNHAVEQCLLDVESRMLACCGRLRNIATSL